MTRFAECKELLLKIKDNITNVEIIENEFKKLSKLIIDYDDDNSELERENNSLDRKINNLENDISDYEYEMRKLSSSVLIGNGTLDSLEVLKVLSFIAKKYPSSLLLYEFLGDDLISEYRGINKLSNRNKCELSNCKCNKVIGNTADEIRKCAGDCAVNEWVGRDTAGREYFTVTCTKCNKKSNFFDI